MKLRAIWSGNRLKNWGGLRWLEWFLLFFGLAALDLSIWTYTRAMLSQAYEDWSFDQRLRALQPSLAGFVTEEISCLLGRDRPRTGTLESPKVISTSEPAPDSQPLDRLPALSSVIGRLDIPKLHLTAMVREGADSATLRMAVGHIPGTALPGRTGNIGLAGHRDTFFRSLRDVHLNDTIDFHTEHGTYRYIVESTRIVAPRDIQVLAPSNTESLTLVTCYPFYYVGPSPKRFIVRAALAPGRKEASPAPVIATR